MNKAVAGVIGLALVPAGLLGAMPEAKAVPVPAAASAVWISQDVESIGTTRWSAVYSGANCTGKRTVIKDGYAAHGKSVRSLWRGRIRVSGVGTFVFTKCFNPIKRAYVRLSGTKK